MPFTERFKAMTKDSKLPNKLSALIRVALVDLKECEADDKYIINMENWHVPLDKGTCSLCFAGAVMAKTLGARIHTGLDPSDFDDSLKLRALDYVRAGTVGFALGLMSQSKTPVYDGEEVVYKDDPELFHEQMGQLADDLQADKL